MEKTEKELYIPSAKPTLVTVPKQRFFTLQGKGNPNDEAFAEAVGVLYSLSYGVKMRSKKGPTPSGYFDYTVFPLEGLWRSEKENAVLDKNTLLYNLMIRQVLHALWKTWFILLKSGLFWQKLFSNHSSGFLLPF